MKLNRGHNDTEVVSKVTLKRWAQKTVKTMLKSTARKKMPVIVHDLGCIDKAFAEAVVTHVNVSRHFQRVCESRELAQAVIRRTAPKVLEPPRVSTEAVLRGHARILGVTEAEYIDEMLKRD
ncbi:hypothetical protein AB833_10075 [Chromatiales bacterium (ex Bugula neritina AB1)]|nr:hypothetical protein AB833_10075 [Chromatiales bacterium (ex Bugula neritina AB1)]